MDGIVHASRQIGVCYETEVPVKSAFTNKEKVRFLSLFSLYTPYA